MDLDLVDIMKVMKAFRSDGDLAKVFMSLTNTTIMRALVFEQLGRIRLHCRRLHFLYVFLLSENSMASTFSLVKEVNSTKKNWALRVLVVRAYETSSRDNPDEKSTLEFVFQDMKVMGRDILRSKEVSNKQTYLMDIVVQDAE
ncbi:Uncharacterized protein Fot_20659 [Forsythia ovata]|uniref:Uncharacterized protein n=1 Tax=Forsythia ovata TaxID=205694 RepID=A0ABD1USM0_9LAMI